MIDIEPMNIILTLLAGAAGGIALYRLKMPGGGLIGSLLMTAILAITLKRAVSFDVYKIIAQTIAGIFLGTKLGALRLKTLLQLRRPILFVLVGMLLINLISGLTVFATGRIDLVTALFATTTGGIAEMSVISEQMGADALQVSVFQFARILMALGLFTPLVGRLIRRLGTGTYQKEEASAQRVAGAKYSAKFAGALVILVGTGAGVCGYFSRIPAAMMVFPMIAAALLAKRRISIQMPDAAKVTAQILAGSCIGSTVLQRDVLSLPTLLLPLLIALGISFSLCLLLGFLLYRICKLDAGIAFFASVPAGVSDIALIASDYGDGAEIVTILQLARFSGVVLLAPFMIQITQLVFTQV